MPRFLQITTGGAPRTGPPDPAHMARVRKSIQESIDSGQLVATGPLGKRATSAARVIHKDGAFTVEDPPGGDGWMAGGGYSVTEYPSKDAAIEDAKRKLEVMGDGTMELIEVGAMHPRPRDPALPTGVIPYLTFEGAAAAVEFYTKAFGAKEIARMPAEDGQRVMHCQLEINGGAVMLADHFPEYGGGPIQRSESYTMQLVVADGDAWWKRAIDAGCTEKMPFALAPWGDTYGQLVDPYGVVWAINMPGSGR